MNPLLRFGQAVAWAAMLSLAACGGQSEEALLASAKNYLGEGKASSAIVQLKVALQKNAESGPARLLMGKALLMSGDMAGAVAELERARNLKQPDVQVIPPLAEALVSSGQAKLVTERYAQVTLADAKADADLKSIVGFAYIAQGKLDLGAAEVEAALKLDPKQVRARMLKARLLAGRGEVDEALKLTGQVIDDAPKALEARQLRAELLWLGKSDAKGAVAALRELLAAEPSYLPAHSALISLLLQNRDTAGFKSQLEALKKAWPKHPVTQLFEAQAAMVDGDLKRAREGVQQLLRIAPDNVSVLQLAGAIELQAGAMMQAVSYLNKAVQVSPSQPLARRLLAEAHLRMGQPAKALASLQPLLSQPQPAPEVLALAAQAHLQSGDLSGSETYFSLADKASPGDPKVRAALALTEVVKGNAAQGFSQLESLASAEPTTFADLALISMRMRRNELDEALKAVDRLQAKIPDKPLAPVLRGRILMMRKDLAGARTAFEKAFAVDPAYFPAIASLARLDMMEQKYEQALKRYEEALAREPRNMAAMLAVAELRQRTGAKPEEVAKLLGDAIKLNPADVGPRVALIEHYFAQRDAKAALAAAQEGAAALPDNLDMLDAVGRAQMVAGDLEQAINTFRKIAAAQPTLPGPYLRLADAYLAKRDVPSASQSLQRVLEIDPKHLAAQRGLVKIAMLRKRSDDAIQIARTVQKQRPDDPVGYLMEAEVHAGLKAWDPAVGAFRAALERSPVSDIAVRLHAALVTSGRQAEAERFAENWLRKQPTDAEFLFHLGTMALERKDPAAAEARYRQVLSLRPDNAAANNNIASMLLQQGKPGALPYAERANQLLPNQAAILDTLASAQAAEKQFKQAVESQQRALALSPNSAGFRLSLAKYLIQAGDRSAAKAELDKLARLGDKFAAQDEVANLLKGL